MATLGSGPIRGFATAALALLAAAPAAATRESTFDDFDSGSASGGWSTGQVAPGRPPTETGGYFLGEFGNGSVLYTAMDALPAGDLPDFYSPRLVRVDLDLLVLGDWRGDEFFTIHSYASSSLGLDSRTQLSTSFQNTFELGGVLYTRDQLQHLSFEFPIEWGGDCCTDFVIDFAATGLNADASWGLDNVSVDWTQVIPEPGSGALLGAGLALLAMRRHRGPLH